MRVVVTRPDPAATTARFRAAGIEVIENPLLVTAALGWEPPDAPPDAIAFTSANGVAYAGAGAGRYAGLPVFAVGAATMAAAQAAGWADVRYGGGTAAALFDWVAAAGVGRVLHLAGADRVAVTLPPGLRVIGRAVYAAALVPLGPAAAAAVRAGAVVPLYSARTAGHFAAEVDRLGLVRFGVDIAAISAAVAIAAGDGWRTVATATAPTGDALFAATLRLCDKRG